MKLQIVRIVDRGVPNKERLHLSVLQDVNLSFYVVLHSRYATPQTISSGHLLAYWFPNQQVRTGDQVVLLSGPGTNTSRKEPGGTTTYFYYWGLKDSLWGQFEDCAVVVEALSWSTSIRGG